MDPRIPLDSNERITSPRYSTFLWTIISMIGVTRPLISATSAPNETTIVNPRILSRKYDSSSTAAAKPK